MPRQPPPKREISLPIKGGAAKYDSRTAIAVKGRLRKIARQLNKVLARAGLLLRNGADGPAACARASQDLLDAGFTSVDYVAFADPDNLAPLTVFEGRGRVLAAVRLGKTRLIDNMSV